MAKKTESEIEVVISETDLANINEEDIHEQDINEEDIHLQELEEIFLRFIGENSSYTVGEVRFEKGEVKAVLKDYAELLLETGKFERA